MLDNKKCKLMEIDGVIEMLLLNVLPLAPCANFCPNAKTTCRRMDLFLTNGFTTNLAVWRRMM